MNRDMKERKIPHVPGNSNDIRACSTRHTVLGNMISYGTERVAHRGEREVGVGSREVLKE